MVNIRFGFTGGSDFIEKFSKLVEKGLYIILAVSGTVLFGLSNGFIAGFSFKEGFDKEIGFLDCLLFLIWNPMSGVIVGSLLIMFGAIGTYRDQKNQSNIILDLTKEQSRIRELEISLDDAQEESESFKNELSRAHENLAKAWLKMASITLGLGSTERVTIFCENQEHFFNIGRFSSNPVYSKVHRDKFQLDDGVVSKAWQHRECIEDGCPSYKDDGYNAYLAEHYGLDEERISNLKMKSCRYIAIAIRDAYEHTGVIVFESTSMDFINQEMVKAVRQHCAGQQSQLAKFVRDALVYNRAVTDKEDEDTVSAEAEMESIVEGFQ